MAKKNTKTRRQSAKARAAEKLGPTEDAPEAAPGPSTAAERAGRGDWRDGGNKTLQAHADMLIAEAGRMRADEVPADVQAAVRSLRKWRSK